LLSELFFKVATKNAMTNEQDAVQEPTEQEKKQKKKIRVQERMVFRKKY
jgi:hypothetical protein